MDTRTIVILEGSPRRNGNSTILARRLAEGAREAGAAIAEFPLRELRVAPCTACEACHGPAKRCAIKDDMQAIYEAIRGSTALVFASPVYWFSVGAQLKAAIDRLYAFGGENWAPLRDKRYAVILAYGDEDLYSSGGINAVRSFEDSFRFLGAGRAEFLYGSADKPGDIEADVELMERAFELGKRLGA